MRVFRKSVLCDMLLGNAQHIWRIRVVLRASSGPKPPAKRGRTHRNDKKRVSQRGEMMLKERERKKLCPSSSFAKKGSQEEAGLRSVLVRTADASASESTLDRKPADVVNSLVNSLEVVVIEKVDSYQ